MYIYIFYTLLIGIIFSLFLKFSPNFFEQNFFSKNEEVFEEKMPLNITDEKKEIEWNSKWSNKEEIFQIIKKIEWRWDFYAQQNFTELAINEYNNVLLQIEDFWSSKDNIIEIKKTIFKKIYKNQNLIWNFKKAEKNILNLISISSDENFVFDLIRNKIDQKDLKKAQLILDRIKNKNYKYFYFDFILNLNLNEDLKILEKKFNNLKKLTRKFWDKNYKSKVFVLNWAIEEFKTYRDSQNIHLYTLIWKALTNSFEFEVSNKILWDILKKREDYRDAKIIFAYNKIRQWDAKKWLQFLIEAGNIDSSKPEIKFYKAIAYEDLWNNIKAKHNFLIALKNWFEPKSQIYQKLAEIYFNEWDFWESVNFYKKMLSVNSDKIEYFLLPFEIAVENQKDFVLALKIAQWAKKKHPKSPLSNSILWYWYFLNWDLKSAKKFINISKRLNGNLARNYLYEWEISIKEWNVEKALKQFEFAYKKNANWKIWEKAIKFYNKLIK